MSWSGRGIVFPRDDWELVRKLDLSREEGPLLNRPGIYILEGPSEDEHRPQIYIGEADDCCKRIEQQRKAKDFWNRAVCFVSPTNDLNKAHVKWIEFELHKRAMEAAQSVVSNGQEPQRTALSQVDRIFAESFLSEVLRILPLVEIRSFHVPKKIEVPVGPTPPHEVDTIIVPAKEEGFNKVFLGENRWYAIRIAGGQLHKIKYIAAYQTSPISSVTHYAQVAEIQPFGDNGKFQLIFKEPAQSFPKPIPFGNAKWGTLQGPRYTRLDRLRNATDLSQI